MENKSDVAKMGLIAGLIAVFTLLHYSHLHGKLGIHMVHRELFFIPIIMASFWYGLKIGFITSFTVSCLYAPYVYIFKISQNEVFTVIFQIVVFNLVAVIMGFLVQQERRRQEERDFINETFGRYADEDVRDQILSGRVPLDGEFKEATVLFADMRDFSKLVEKTSAKEVVQIMNTYFREMSEAIKKNKGHVLQFIGDEIEAVFGAPKTTPDHQENAINAAIEMNKRLVQINIGFTEQGFKPIRHGIGIHTGQVLLANIGSSDRLSYTMIGNTVIIASRIQELTKKYLADIILSDKTRTALPEGIQVIKRGLEKVKGISEPVEIYGLHPGADRVI